MVSGEENPSRALRRLIDGFQVSQAIHVAAVLGIADHLKDDARTSDELAQATGSHPESLYRVLRALAAVGLFHEDGDRRFSLTELGSRLRSDDAEPVGGWAAWIGQPSYWQAWGNLLHSVKTGETAFRHLNGMDVWEYRAQHPEVSAAFDRAMTSRSRRDADAIIASYDFGRFKRIVDVGAGQGALISKILAKHPDVHGVVFDQPHVVTRAEQTVRAAGVAERCDVVGGNFFKAVPKGGDAYLMRDILHDWEDAEVLAILRSCRQSIEPQGKLLVIERLLGKPNEGPDAKFSDLNMLVSPGGRERTREQYAALFAATGFRLSDTRSVGMDYSIIEAVPTTA